MNVNAANKPEVNYAYMRMFRDNPLKMIGRWVNGKDILNEYDYAAIDAVILNFKSPYTVKVTRNPAPPMRRFSQPHYHIVTPDGYSATIDGGVFRANNPEFLLRFIEPKARPFILELVKSVRSAA